MGSFKLAKSNRGLVWFSFHSLNTETHGLGLNTDPNDFLAPFKLIFGEKATFHVKKI